jgi:integrase
VGKVRVKKETGRLYLDFMYQGVRCREFTSLSDTAANRRRVQALMDKVDREIALGKFNFRETFPGSPRADRFDAVDGPASGGLGSAKGQVDHTPRFRAFAETWVDENRPAWRRSYEETVIGTLNQYLLPRFGNRTVGSITRAELLAFRADLSKTVSVRGKPLSNTRINKIMGFARQIMNEAADRYEFRRPFQGIKPLKQKKPDIHPFTLEEVNRILQTVRSDYRNYLAVRFWTGLRTGEANALRWDRIDFDNNMILVRDTLVRGRLQSDTKTYDSSRDVPMLPPVRDALLDQRRRVPKGVDWVFCTKRGSPIDNQNFTKRVWAPLLAELGLKYRRPYQTRHTAATLMLGAGEAPEWIARVLGHTTTEMLFRVYSRYVPNLTRQDGSAMARLLASQVGALNYNDNNEEDD